MQRAQTNFLAGSSSTVLEGRLTLKDEMFENIELEHQASLCPTHPLSQLGSFTCSLHPGVLTCPGREWISTPPRSRCQKETSQGVLILTHADLFCYLRDNNDGTLSSSSSPWSHMLFLFLPMAFLSAPREDGWCSMGLASRLTTHRSLVTNSGSFTSTSVFTLYSTALLPACWIWTQNKWQNLVIGQIN